MIDDDRAAGRIDDREIEMLLASMARSALPRRGLIASTSGPDVEERLHDGRPMPDFVASELDHFRERVNPALHLELHDAVFHKVTAELDMTIGGYLDELAKPEPRDLLHVYGPDRDSTGEQRYYRFAWVDHSQFGTVTTPAPVIVRSGRLAASCGVYGGQSAFSLAGAGMLFTAEHGIARVAVRPYLPWVALTSFNHFAVGASVRCRLGILVQSWAPGDSVAVEERKPTITVLSRSSAEGYLLDAESSGTGGAMEGLTTDFVAVPGRNYAIYVFAWLEATGGATSSSGPLAYSRIEVDASVPFVVAEETLL